MIPETCPFCGASPMYGLLEIWDHDWMPDVCCEQAQSLLEDFSRWEPEDRRAFFQAICGAEVRGITADCDIDYHVQVRPIDQRPAFDYINAWHRHHKAPVGWKFGLAAWNGPTLVGVAVTGRPVSRVLASRGWWEVTRLCTRTDWPNDQLVRHVASQLYAACRREARRLGHPILTYTLESESGASVAAAGFKKVQLTKGGSWSCPSRPRTDKAPIVRKWRWESA